MTANTQGRIDAAAVRSAAAGRWKEILEAAGIPAGHLDGKGHPCPRCGGSDRFAAFGDVNQRGAVICRHCFAKGGGDGLATIQWVRGCTFPEAVRWSAEYLGLTASGNGATAKKPRRIVTHYNYRDAQGKLVFQTVRFDPKDFRQRRPNPDGEGWVWNLRGVEPIPYRLPELLADPAALVLIVEGEKDADALARTKMVATCNHGGAGKWTAAHSKHLSGRAVAIVPDNDEPGEQHAEAVAASLQGVAAIVKIVRPPGLPAKGDVSDWLDSGGTREQLLELIAAASEWQQSVDIRPSGHPRRQTPERFQRFPTQSLPEPIRGFVEGGARAIGCEPSFIALPLLAVLGAAIGNTRRLQLKQGWAAPPILWTAIVGESGTAKTPAFHLAKLAMEDRQGIALDQQKAAEKEYEAALARYERDLANWKRGQRSAENPPHKPEMPQAERCLVSDTTVEGLAPILLANPRGLLVARDELAGWIGSFDRYSAGKRGGGDAAHWLSMFNGNSLIVDRKTGFPRTIFVPRASVSVTGGIQPGILRRVLGAEHWESGLAARLLLACPPRQPKRWTTAGVSDEQKEVIAQLIERLYDLQMVNGRDGKQRPFFLTMDRDARDLWAAYYDGHADEQVDLRGDLAAAWSKLEEYAARLALVVHCTRWATDDPTLRDSDAIDGLSMESGIALAQWFKRETRRVYALLGESDEQSDQRQLVEWLERRGGEATVRDIVRGNSRFETTEAAEAALIEIQEAGLGKFDVIPSGPKGGRPSRVFRLHDVTDERQNPTDTGDHQDLAFVSSGRQQDTQSEDDWLEI